ncbi:STM3941 family protein [Macrococcus capreoli]
MNQLEKKEYVLQPKRFKLGCLSIFMIFVTGFMIMAAIQSYQEQSTSQALLFGAGALLFIVIAFFFIKKALNKNPMLVITDEGFYDYTTVNSLSDKMIPWSAVEKIETKYQFGEPYASIYLKHPDEILADTKQSQKLIAKVNSNLDAGHINIMLQNLARITPNQAIYLINETFEEYKENHAARNR